jgi:superkiller protein 3
MSRLFLISLLIRLIFHSQIISTPVFYGLVQDSQEFDNFAIQILNGNFSYHDLIYLNALYPFFLALIYAIFGHYHLPVIIIQGIIDSISCLLIYNISVKLFNKKVGFIAGLIYAFYGIAIFYTGVLLASTLIISLTLLFINLLLIAHKTKKLNLFFIAGLFFGLVFLARQNIILFIIILPVWFFRYVKKFKDTIKPGQNFIGFLLGFIVIISLITIRNYSIEKRLYPFSSHGGINFYIGNNSKATGQFMSPNGISQSPIEQVRSSISYVQKEYGAEISPSKISHYWFNKGLNFIKDSPVQALSITFKKFILFWRKEEIPLNINYHFTKTLVPILKLPWISFGFITPLAIWGIFLSLRRKKDVLLIILYIFSYMISIILFFVCARYRLPVVPFLIIFSSYTLYEYIKSIKMKQFKTILSSIIILIILFAGININFLYFQSLFDPSVDHNNLGTVYIKQGLLNKAILEFNKVIELNPKHVQAHYNLGFAYYKQGQLNKAIIEYQKAIELDQYFYSAYNNLAIIYLNQGLLKNAIQYYKKAITLHPEYDKAHYGLGEIYFRKNQLKEAEIEFKRVIEINPQFIEAYYNLGLIFSKQDKWHEAIIQWQKVLILNSNYELAEKQIKKAREILNH